MTIEIERYPYPFDDDKESDVKGWVVPVRALNKVIDTPVAQDEGVWMAVRDKETGEYIDPERFGLFIRHKKETVAEDESTVYIWYGGDPDISGDDDGWFDDFPPIPPGP